MIQTYFIYIYLLVFCCGVAYIAETKEEKKLIFLIVFVLSFFAGLRGYSVGIDTSNYVGMFQLIGDGQSELAYGLEGTFKVMCFILMKIGRSPSFLLIVFALITNTFVVLRLWDFRKISSFGCMIFCYYVSFYFISLNIMRQLCAVAIVFYATRYIEKRKYILFLIGIAIAFLFHKSALLGLGFLGIEIVLLWNYLSKRQKRVIIGFLLLCVPVCLVAATKYVHYFENITLNLGFMLPAKLCLFIVSAIGLKTYAAEKQNRLPDERVVYEVNVVDIYYCIGLLITFAGYFFTHMERIGLAFYLFECVYMGFLVKQSRMKNIYRVIVFVLFMYIFVNSLLGNGQGQMPYTFVWQ